MSAKDFPDDLLFEVCERFFSSNPEISNASAIANWVNPLLHTAHQRIRGKRHP